VRFERRQVVGAGDGYGNSDGDWLPLIARRSAKLTPRSGGEQVVAERLQGVSSWDLWVRFDQATSQVSPATAWSTGATRPASSTSAFART
jgi:hypothetical protein